MRNPYFKVEKINDPRLVNYTNRNRSGSEQVFYTGGDERDFDRYKADQAASNSTNVKMHDKSDTIRLRHAEKHLFAELIDGEWWWVNGCYECNGLERDWMCYVECDHHNVCRSCKTPRSEIKESVWGGKHGWQCNTCEAEESLKRKRDALAAVADEEFDDWDFSNNDQVVCPHCKSKYSPDEPSDGDVDCGTCGGEFTVEIEYSISYTTKLKGKRLTLDDIVEELA